MTESNRASAYELWNDGLLSPHLAIGAIASDLAESMNELEVATAAITTLKAQLGHIMASLQTSVSDREYREYKDMLATRGLTISFSRPYQRVSVDHNRLRVLLSEYEDQIPTELAAMLRSTIRETMVEGGQRIGRVKENADADV